jgi:hypothetical protein
MHSIRINEQALQDAVLLALNDSGLRLVAASGDQFKVGYSPSLALAQCLQKRILYATPVIMVVEVDDR